MFFSKDDYLKIEKWLQHRAIKDTQLPFAKTVGITDIISIVQDGQNKQLTLRQFFSDFAAKVTTLYVPDEEDLTAVANDDNGYYIKFKDKEYDADSYSGLGRIFLRKLDDGIITQDCFNTSNTIYIIQYDYDLNGETITMPEGCILYFIGGHLNNGTLVLQETAIDGVIRFSDIGSITYSGTFVNGQIMAFEDYGYEATDNLYNNNSEETDYVEIRYWDTDAWVKLSIGDEFTDEEKTWVKEQVIASNLTASIARSVSSCIFVGSPITITFTLTVKYQGTLVDLDEIPDGWIYSSTGTYKKTVTVTGTTGTSVSSGTASCTYNGGTVTASSVSCTVIKYSFYRLTSSSNPSLGTLTYSALTASATKLTSTNSIAGDYEFTVGSENQYIYFFISSNATLNSITQLGVDFLADSFTYNGTSSSNGYVSVTLTDDEDTTNVYKVYRSANMLASGTTQSITIA